jgi:uncharacterized protein
MTELRAIAKAVSGCNLQCRYCSAGNAVQQVVRVMSSAVLERMIAEFLDSCPEGVEFSWHGGEPMLASLPFYREAVVAQARCRRPGQSVENGLQSNLSLLDDEWLDFFEQNNFVLGASLDGPARIHEYHRPYVGGRSSFQDVMRGIRLIQGRGMHLSVSAVVTSFSAPYARDIFEFFLANDIKTFDFLACAGVNQATGSPFDMTVSPVAYGRFMKEIFDLWVERDDPEIRIRHLENALDGVMGGVPSLCNFAGGCDTMITIDYNGDVYPCDFFLDHEEFRFGNILDSSLADILSGERRRSFLEGVSAVADECAACEWFGICHGDCAHRRYMVTRNFQTRGYYCTSRKLLFQHMHEAVSA